MARTTLLIKSGNLFFRFRNALFPIFIVCVFLFTRPAYFLRSEPLDTIAVAMGIMVALAGQALRLLVIGFAYIKRGGKDGRVYADTLVSEGFYAHVRNPMYIGNFLILVGVGIIYGSAWIYLVVVPFFSFVYLSIVVTEEHYLRGRFGAEYDAYCKRVNRFLPNFRGIRKSLAHFHYDWRKALRKDYGTFFGVLFGCLATALTKQYYFRGIPNNRRAMLAPVALFTLLVLGYLVIRYLKKNNKLQSPA